MSLNEVLIFHHAIQNLKIISKQMSELNLTSIPEPEIDKVASSVQNETITPLQKRAQKMFYKVWSATTKYLRAVIYNQRKPLEIADFGVFMPIQISNSQRRSNSTGIDFTNNSETKKQTSSGANVTVHALINNEFMIKCNNILQVAEGNNSNNQVRTFNQEDREYFKGLQQLNFFSLAKVCQTDPQTVELVLKEIFSAMVDLINNGQSLILNIKIGKLSFRNGYIMFKQFNHTEKERDKSVNITTQSSVDQNSNYDNYSMVGSVYRANLSVATPSIAGSIAPSLKSSDRQSFHISNPNPQNGQSKYQGIRDQGYFSLQQSPDPSQTSSSSMFPSPNTHYKFGKKVFLDNKISNKDVFQTHLNQIRYKNDSKKYQHETKLKEDQDFLRFVQNQLRKDRERQEHRQGIMKKDFLDFNGNLKAKNESSKQQEIESKRQEIYKFFPFTHGEEVEKNREQLKDLQKNDLLQYIENKKMPSSTQQNFSKSTKSVAHHQRSISDSYNSSRYNISDIGNGGSLSVRNDAKMLNCISNNGNKLVMKSIFDQVQVDRNKLLIYDDDPHKEAAMKAARDRFEEHLKWKSQINQSEDQKIQEYNQQIKRTYDQQQIQTQRRKEEMKYILQQQMKIKRDSEDLFQSQVKANYATHFGPEESEDIVKERQDKLKDQQLYIKQQLLTQIKDKQLNLRQNQQIDSQFDKILIETNLDRIENEKQSKKSKLEDQRNNLKEIWRDQIQKKPVL